MHIDSIKKEHLRKNARAFINKCGYGEHGKRIDEDKKRNMNFDHLFQWKKRNSDSVRSDTNLRFAPATRSISLRRANDTCDR